MATVAKSDRSTTIVLAATSAGPFDLDFRLFDTDELKVYVNNIARTDFTINGTFSDGYTDEATVTFANNLSPGDTIIIDGALFPRREQELLDGVDLVDRQNIELARIWSVLSEHHRDISRSARFFSAVSPIALMAGTALMVNDGGNGLEAGPDLATIAGAAQSAQAAEDAADRAETAADALEAAVNMATAFKFTGAEITDPLDLPITPPSSDAVVLFAGGAYQTPDVDFTLSGNRVTPVGGWPAGITDVSGVVLSRSLPPAPVDSEHIFGSWTALKTWRDAGNVAENGSVIVAGKMFFRWASGASGIAALPDIEPMGRVFVDHFADNILPGVTDMTPAINAAKDYQAARGGGTVWLLGAVYLVTDQSVSPANWDDRIAIHILNNEIHFAAEPGSGAIVRLADGEDAHVFKFGRRIGNALGAVAVHGGSIKHIEVDGNRDNQTTPTPDDFHGAGIDICDNCSRIVIEDSFVHHTQYYGVGFQREGHVSCRVENTVIEDTGADGIDAKSDDGTSYGNQITNVVVRRFGLALTTLDTPQAGIDIRSGFTVREFRVVDWQAPLNPVPANQRALVGIRNLTNVDSNFNAVSPSAFTNGYVEPNVTTVGTSPVQRMQGARIDAMYNGIETVTFSGCGEAARISQREGNLRAILAIDGIDGIILQEGSNPTDADQYSLVGCVVRNNSGTGTTVGENILNASIIGCTSRGNAVGLRVENGAVDTRVIAGSIFANTTDNIVDNGTNTTVVANEGGIETDYQTRAAFASDVANAKFARIGQIVFVEGSGYERDGTSTHLPSLTGWKEYGAKTYHHFGARGDGTTDDTAAMAAALKTGGEFEPLPGTYLMAAAGADAGGVTATISSDLTVINGPGVIYKAGTDLDNDIVRIDTTTASYNAGNRPGVHWVGGLFDQRGQKNSTVVPYRSSYPAANLGSSATCDGLSVRGEVDVSGVKQNGFSRIVVEGVETLASDDEHWETAGGDSGVFAAGSTDIRVSGGRFVGNRDLGVYISGLSGGEVTNGKAVASDNQFIGCMFGASVKRAFENVILKDNVGINTAVVATATDVTTTGHGVIIANNIGHGAWAVARADATSGAIITGNLSKNHGHVLNDGSAPTSVFHLGNACVQARGLTHSHIANNRVLGLDGTATFTTAAVLFENDGTQDATDNTALGNGGDGYDGSANGPLYAVLETSGEADRNEVSLSRVTRSTQDAVVLAGASSVDRDKKQKYSSNATQTITGTGATTTLDSTTIRAGTVGRDGRIKLVAFGTITGSAGTKTFSFTFGSATITLAASTSGAVGDWRAELSIYPVNTSVMRMSAVVSIGSELVDTQYQGASVSLDADNLISIRGRLSNSADNITMNWISVEFE